MLNMDLGLSLGANKLRDRIALRMNAALTDGSVSAETKVVFEEWLKGKDNAEASRSSICKSY